MKQQEDEEESTKVEDLEGIARGRKPAEVGVPEAKQGKDFKKEKFNCQMLVMRYLRKNYKVLCK